MPVVQILLILVVFGGLALFAVQNLSPALPIVFLGIRTQALPISAWILVAIASGFFISLFLQLLSYLQRRSLQARIRQLEAEPPRSAPRATYESTNRQTSYTPPPPQKETPPASDESDWDFEGSNDEEEDDWNIEEPPEPTPTQPPRYQEPEPKDYETRQEPKSSSKTGSVYSYSYREPSQSGAGKTEAVYDVNYRVLTPPYRQPPTQPAQEEEDWGFEEDEDEDDDFEDTK